MVVFRATVVVGSLIGFAMAAVDIKNADSAAAEVAKALLMKRFFMTFNQSTTSNRSHAVSFNCRLAGGSSALGIEPVPPRNASIHASETKRPPSPLTLSLAKRVTPATMAVDTPASRWRAQLGFRAAKRHVSLPNRTWLSPPTNKARRKCEASDRATVACTSIPCMHPSVARER